MPMPPCRSRWFMSSFGLVFFVGCVQPVVSGSAAGPVTVGAAPASRSGLALPGGTARGGLLQRGQSFDGVLSQNESHDYLVDLRPGETIHFQVTGVTELSPNNDHCHEWHWSWLGPDNAQWRNGNSGPIEELDNPTAPRSFEVALDTLGERMPGRWTFRLHAGEHCHRIRYRLVSR